MTNPLTDEQKQELARLAEAATAGLWVVQGSKYVYSVGAVSGIARPNLKIATCEYLMNDKADARYIAAACNAVPALLAEIEALRPDALKMREINAKAAELSAQFNADYHFGLPQAEAGSLNRQLKIAIEALERCDHCNCRHGHPDHSLHKEDCPYRIAREALRKIKP